MTRKVLYLRTVFWFNLQSGGSVGHTSGAINGLNKLSELKVISNDQLKGVKIPIILIKPLRIKILPEGFNELLYNFKIKKQLASHLKKTDIIYQRFSGFSFLGCQLAIKYKKYFILEFNSSDVWKLKNWTAGKNIFQRFLKMLVKRVLFLPIVKRIEKYNLTNASMIVVVSEVSKKQLLKRGIPESKILINPNGVDTEQYNPGISGDPVRVLYSIKKTQTVFGFIGTFGQWHGVLEMAQAIVLFYTKYKGKHVKFLLIGNGVLFEQTKKIISKAGLNKHVIFTGQIPQDQGPIHLAACDILLSPHIPNPDGTEFFGSPTKLFEYMAMGKAIIASDLNQIGLVLKHQETAILVNPGDIEELSQSMLSILNNQEQILNLGTNARLKALKEHSWDKHVIRILERINND